MPNLFLNYNNPAVGPLVKPMDEALYNTMCKHLADSQSEQASWWYLVFKPFNASYEKDKDWYKYKSVDYCRKMVPKGSKGLLTVEHAAKLHVNIIVSTAHDLTYLHEKATSRYKIWCKRIDDRNAVFEYCIKDLPAHPEKYKDYLYI